MLKYYSFYFPKDSLISVNYIHLFEHCICKKILSYMDGHKINNVIINGETFLDGCCIDIMSLSEETLNILKAYMDELIFDSSDINLIIDEIKTIKAEVEMMDLTEEELQLYHILQISNDANILELYDSDFPKIDYTKLFNSILDNKKVLYSDSSKIEIVNIEEKYTLEQQQQYSFLDKDNFIKGFIKIHINSIDKLIEHLFLSFVLGRTSKSLIDIEYLAPYNLYLGYTMPVQYFKYNIILFLIETCEESQMKFRENKNKLIFSEAVWLDLVEEFKLFMKFQDPYLLEFNKMLLKCVDDSFNVDITDLFQKFEEIDLTNIRNIIMKGI